MSEIEAVLQVLEQLELESLAAIISILQDQLLDERWMEWTIRSIDEGYRHITDLQSLLQKHPLLKLRLVA